MKVILNKCYGGFEVSHEGYLLYAKKKGFEVFAYELDSLFSTRGWKYMKVPVGKESVSFCNYYFTKDYGEKINEKDINWEDHLFLSGEYREDPVLIEVVEELGTERASGRFGRLVVVEIPDGMDYVIDEYDGIETLHQRVEEW